MSKRITCISLFDEESISKIDNLIGKYRYRLCKIPYLEQDRQNKDTLPYHITLQSWDETQKREALQILEQIEITPIKLIVNSINIKNSYNNAHNLYLGVERNEELLNIYRQFYEITKNSKYNPDTVIPHITLHCDKNYDYIVNIKNVLSKKFKEFQISFKKMGLYEIYPAKRIG